MVSIVTTLPEHPILTAEELSPWLGGLCQGRTEQECVLVRRAFDHALALHEAAVVPATESGLRRVLVMVDILAELGLDPETLAAALLCNSLACNETPEHLRELYGDGVARMIEDMSRIGQLTSAEENISRQDEQAHLENLRRMLLGIADDIRVLLILLADRVYRMRVVKQCEEAVRRREALDTRNIYAPLANRLGIWQVKWELEDLSLRYLEPDDYREIAGLLDGRRSDREQYIQDVVALLNAKLGEAGVRGDIMGRPKHIYSIWRKMRRKNVGLHEIYDLRAVRILVDSIEQCYGALGVVHGLWRHIPGEFDDYIATPKSNGYRSIHTAVIGPEDKTLEVQIRTRQMHEESELGVAAHWRYKEKGKQDVAFERRIVLMRNWLELKDDEEAFNAVGDQLKAEYEPTQIYVRTPHGKVIELPKGATPLDFAYEIHSDVGHRCRGARVDGRIAPLTVALDSGQMVEILTVKEGGPSRDWLSPHSGYVHTSKAKNRIRAWFKQQDFAQHVHIGRAALDKEVARLSLSKPDLEKATQRFSFKTVDDLFAAVGRGELTPLQVIGGLQKKAEITDEEALAKTLQRGQENAAKAQHQAERRPGRHHGPVVVEGLDDLMVEMAKCCKPVPFDPIIGYISKGRGVKIHRLDCTTIRHLPEDDKPRLIEAEWNGGPVESIFQVDLRIIAQDRKGLLRDISSVFANEEVMVTAVNTRTDKDHDRADMHFTIEIKGLEQLSRLLERIEQTPNVMQANRVG